MLRKLTDFELNCCSGAVSLDYNCTCLHKANYGGIFGWYCGEFPQESVGRGLGECRAVCCLPCSVDQTAMDFSEAERVFADVDGCLFTGYAYAQVVDGRTGFVWR